MQGCFGTFTLVFFVICKVMTELFSNLTLFFNIKFLKAARTWKTRTSALVAFALLRQCARCHCLPKNGLPPSHWKRHHTIFLLVQSVSVVVQRFIAGDHFFFLLPIFLSLLVKVHVCPFYFQFFNFNPYVFYCLFSSLTYLEKVFLYFQFNP